MSSLLVSAGASLALDKEAQTDWGFNTFSLIEAAGRGCAQAFTGAFSGLFKTPPRVTVVAGAGNNAADAMTVLRYWVLTGFAGASSASLVLSRMPPRGDAGPRALLIRSLKKMGIPVSVWDGDQNETAGRASADIFAYSDIIVDGIAGTGVKGPLHGAALEMTNAVNTASAGGKKQGRPFVVSVDIPSGNFDGWKPGMPIVKADLTLAIEPRKYCIYTPSARPYAGTVLPVGGVFPKGLIAGVKGAELLDWENTRHRIPDIPPDVYKNRRGTVEIHAGSPGATGAALIAARGAQAAGAGLVRLVVDDGIYPVTASQATSVMVVPSGRSGASGSGDRFKPDALLLGPGWGTGEGRAGFLGRALELEKEGIPLVLDADAISLARDKVFSGRTILTPHPGELSSYTGLSREELLCCPAPVILKYAEERKAVIVFKGHVITIAAPDGRLGVVDGMCPVLAAGGNGDLLAGFCAAISARVKREDAGSDLYTCAAAAAALLIASGTSDGIRNRFSDPLELADKAADLAGAAWLSQEGQLHERQR